MNLNFGKNILNLGVCFQTIAQVIYIALYGSALGVFLFLELDISEPTVFLSEKGLALGLFALVTLLIVNKFNKGLLLIGSFFLVEALMVWNNGGKPHSQLALFTHMARYLSPFALYFLLQGKEKIGIYLLKWAIGFTFIFHGIKALQYNPLFIDYLMEGFEGLLGSSIPESTAKQYLVVIGIIDIILGVLSLFKCPPWVYLYMAIWGGLTAWFRVYFHGELGILPMFIRFNHLLIPVFLGFHLRSPNSAKVEALHV